MLAADRNYAIMLKNPLNLCLKKGFCGAVKDMGSFFKFFPHLIKEALEIVLQMADTIKLFRDNGCPLSEA